MSKKHNDQNPARGIILFACALLIIAALISIYLAYASFGGSGVAGCGPDSGCDKVLHSRWSKWLGIPVSVPAVLLYALMIAATLRLSPESSPLQQRKAWSFLVPGAWAIIGAVVWFIALQFFVIKAVCPYCMAAHACGLIAAVALLFNAPVREAPEKPWQREKEVYVVPKHARNLIAIALGCVGLLVAGQLVYRPKQFKVTSVAEPTLQQVETNRVFQIYEGRFAFNLNEVPLIGVPAAPHAMVSLFDYTCHHCRIMHGTLKDAHKRFGDQLAIVSLPMPLDGACNYTVRRTPPAHTNACEYARLGLAVWHANRKVHEQFDDWLFTPEHPPDLSEARQYAAQLVGREKLEAAFTNQWVDKYLQLGIDIYATNFIHVRQGAMPQVIIGTNLLTGTLAMDELYRRLDSQLGLKATNLLSKTQ